MVISLDQRRGVSFFKVLLRRGDTKEGEFIHVPAGWNDHDLFGIIWGPASAALSFVFDKSGRETILQVASILKCNLLEFLNCREVFRFKYSKFEIR